MANTLMLNGIDFSAYVQWQVDRTEKIRKVYGPNGLTDIDGNEYPDLIAVKVDPSWQLRPLPKSLLQNLYTIMAENTVTAVYTSFLSDSTVTATLIPQDFTLKYATESSYNGDVYEGATISFKEK